MAIYHCSAKAISRKAGRSSTAAAAYRAGCVITDPVTGEVHDFRRKSGVLSADIVLPAGVSAEWATDRAKLWNAAELAEKRKDACVAREYEVALPSELSPKERHALALDFAKRMADREGCAVDVCIHAPGKEGDNRNHHAHILRTTRKVEPDGLGAKLDTEKAGRKRSEDLEFIRAEWAGLTNAALERAGLSVRVDHRSHAERGIEQEPTRHLGPAATGWERRTGLKSDVRLRHEAEAAERLESARRSGLEEREIDKTILDLETELSAAIRERDALQAGPDARAPTPRNEPTPAERLAELIQRQPAKQEQPKLDLSGDIQQAKADARARLESSLPDVRARMLGRAQQVKAEREAQERAELEARRQAEAEAQQAKALELEQQKRTKPAKDRDRDNDGPSLSW